MKIIGNNGANYSSDKIYFLSATKTELLNLMGYQYGESKVEQLIDKAGSEIPISAMFDRLYHMANKEKELMEISAKLKAAADFVDAALPTIKQVNKKEKEEE
jgi:hypothetical protein